MPEQPDSTDKIAAWLDEQGFWLEHHTHATLQRSGWWASLGRVYRDPQSGKLRDIDVLADPLLRAAPIQLRAAFECKAGKSGAWVIRQAEIRKSEIAVRPIASPRASDFMVADAAILRQSLQLTEPVGFSALVVGKDKVAFDALQQAASAARGALTLNVGSTFVHPVVVTDSPLYGLSYDHDDQRKLTAIPWWRVVHSGGEYPVLVDVVQRDSLRDYLINLRPAFDMLADSFRDFGWTPDE